MLKLTCLNCSHEFVGTISFDSLGWHSVCPKCGSSFDVDAPEGRIKMLFLDTEEVEECDFDCFYNGEAVCSFYTFDTVKEFFTKWKEISECPDSMWYLVFDGDIKDENCICSGACDPYDIGIFMEHFFCNEDGICYPKLHERNPKYTYWLYDPDENRVYGTEADIAGRRLVYQKRRNALFYDGATNKPLVPQPAFHAKHLLNRGIHLADKYIPANSSERD